MSEVTFSPFQSMASLGATQRGTPAARATLSQLTSAGTHANVAGTNASLALSGLTLATSVMCEKNRQYLVNRIIATVNAQSQFDKLLMSPNDESFMMTIRLLMEQTHLANTLENLQWVNEIIIGKEATVRRISMRNQRRYEKDILEEDRPWIAPYYQFAPFHDNAQINVLERTLADPWARKQSDYLKAIGVSRGQGLSTNLPPTATPAGCCIRI